MYIGDSLTFGVGASSTLPAGGFVTAIPKSYPTTTDRVSRVVTELATIAGPRKVMGLNGGASGTQASDWISGASPLLSFFGPASGNGLYRDLVAIAATASFVPNLIVVALGTNDNDTSEYATNMPTIISQLATDYPGVKVMLMHPPLGQLQSAAAKNDVIGTINASLASATVIPIENDGVGWCLQSADNYPEVNVDITHFTDAGYAMMAKWDAYWIMKNVIDPTGGGGGGTFFSGRIFGQIHRGRN